jgi:histidinol dehydrogenase
MNKTYNPNKADWFELLKRPTQTVENIENTVNEIFNDVQRQGDKAILKYTEMFDGVKLEAMIVSPEEIENASNSVS